MKRLLTILFVLFALHLMAQPECKIVYSRETGQPNLFVYSLKPQGFVIVSALNEVLAYSFESNLSSLDSLPEPMAYWIDLYNEQTDYLIHHPDQSRFEQKSHQSVEPLLTSQWAQGCYYNESCPVDTLGPCQHVYAGCVAIAMAQIMYFHKWPLTGYGSTSYSCSPYGTLSANFGTTSYQWNAMVDHLNGSNTAIAQLISHCGISVKMQYSPNGSGASLMDALNAFHQNFLYPTGTPANRSQCTDEEWGDLIKNNLDKGLPVYYAGTSSQGRHAFVCDGYDSDGLFHFNFGWNGEADGYYSLSDPGGFSSSQNIIYNLYPANSIPISSDSHGIIYVATDGTGDGSSWEHATKELLLALYKSQMEDCSVWVKKGTYFRPGEDYMLFINQKCRLYGGFKGDEPYDYDLSRRNFDAHPSILDGRQRQGIIVVKASDRDVLIDGFTIQNGKAMLGGGFNLVNGNVQIRNCTFRYNQAMKHGGAVYDRSGAQYHSCSFHNNSAEREGGAVAVYFNKSTFWNCLINNNTARTGGGCYSFSEAKLFNCTITRNKAQDDFGGIYYPETIRNCIIWGNTSNGGHPQIGPYFNYSYCAVENDLSERGNNFNINSENDGNEPAFYVRFNNPTAIAGSEGQGGDWRLQANSLCIDRVDDIANQPDTDLDGNPRHRHNKVDLGAYESDVAASFISNFLCDEEPYYFQDSLLSDLGCYSFLFPGHPYDSLVVIEMMMPSGSIELSAEICENETYDFFGTPLNQSGTYQTVHQCVGFTLYLTVDSISVVHLQEEICDHDSYNFFGTPLTEAGHYSTINDCKRYELDLTVTPSPPTPIFLTETICEGDVYYFHGRPLINEGHYSSFHDCNQYELELTVAPLFELHCPHDTIVPYQYPVTLSARGANTYLWSTGDTTASITVSPIKDITYTVTGFSEIGCEVTKTIDVKVTMDNEEIVLFPNPAQNILNVYMPLIDEVEILNLFGECVRHAQVEREVATLDISSLPDGTYIVHVRELYKHFYKTFVICH